MSLIEKQDEQLVIKPGFHSLIVHPVGQVFGIGGHHFSSARCSRECLKPIVALLDFARHIGMCPSRAETRYLRRETTPCYSSAFSDGCSRKAPTEQIFRR